MPHIRRIFHVPPALEDLFVADLWEEGTLGVVSTAEPDGRLRLEAWFDQGSPAWEPGGWAERGVRFSGGGPVIEQDWIAGWRAQAQPFVIGRTFFLDPREPEDELPEVPDG